MTTGTSTAADRLLTLAQLADMIGVHQETINRWRKQGKFPQPRKLGRLVRWHESDVRNWWDELDRK